MSAGWRVLATVAAVLAAAALLAGAFALGVRVGAAQAYRAGYHDVLPPPPPPSTRTWLSGHGILGTVEQVDLNTRLITVRSERGVYSLVQVGEGTLLERWGQTVDLAKVRPGERIVVIGAPDDQGHVVARVVRLLDVPGKTRPLPLWAWLARGIQRIYDAIERALQGALGRMGS